MCVLFVLFVVFCCSFGACLFFCDGPWLFVLCLFWFVCVFVSVCVLIVFCLFCLFCFLCLLCFVVALVVFFSL